MPKRDEKLEAALRNLVDVMDEVTPHIDAMCAFGAVHGNEYAGPTYGEALKAAKAVLSEECDAPHA